MRKIKQWLIDRVLPVWAKKELIAENARLRNRISQMEQELLAQANYIHGLEIGMRATRKIIINSGEVNK